MREKEYLGLAGRLEGADLTGVDDLPVHLVDYTLALFLYLGICGRILTATRTLEPGSSSMAIVEPGIGELADMVDIVEPGIGQVSRQLEAVVAM